MKIYRFTDLFPITNRRITYHSPSVSLDGCDQNTPYSFVQVPAFPFAGLFFIELKNERK